MGCSIHHITLSSFDDRREVLSVGNALFKFSYKDPFREVEGEMEEDLAYTLLNWNIYTRFDNKLNCIPREILNTLRSTPFDCFYT